MRRLVLAGTLVVAAVGIASAGPTRKVHIDSEPEGATIYLDDVEKGPVCDKTPCDFDSPLGKHTIIVRLEKYEPDFMEIDVTKGKKPITATSKLKSAMGTIVVDVPKDAAVRVDEEDSGKAPTRVAVTSGEGHHVVITKDGKKLFDEFVMVATGEEVPVVPKGAGGSSKRRDSDKDKDKDKDEDGGGGGGGGSATISSQGSASPRSGFVAIGVAVDVGFRSFNYVNPVTTDTLRPEDEARAIVGPAVEVWPGRLAGVYALRGLSLFARFQFNVVAPSVQALDFMGTVTSSWSSYETSLRQRWTFGSAGIEASIGYVQDNFRYDAQVTSDFNKLPDAEYKSVRLGGKLVYASDKFEPFVAVEPRIVLSGGTIVDRFSGAADVYGIKATLGFDLKLTPSLVARAAAGINYYGWEFRNDTTMAMYVADGASDRIVGFSLLAGYVY